ncbi:TPA: hypothetical protein NKQ48_000951 [Vibrio parahaemolyticus]|uniref:hypothetical protein n=1 Tax=Vibrio parahaemolyticus TaxID=670 RepID=UPI00186A4764|nr:hypothetical protein [Vibrio parahaemolyticus]MBE5185462.1 hypothetical protein [Vibrio parahaemolyticus]MBE5198536.1 hypothetical protein [Vibrio parahaemolyticus]MDF5309718.1 hypothetical protein [Vibrio parahaemolyticus]MDF5314662.1 hypothetical protein [Vibrio parahaemolyticus]
MNEFDKLVSRFIPSHEQIRWNNLKDKLEFVANYYATADDLAYLGRVAIALSGSAAPIAVERYGGFNHIVLLLKEPLVYKGKLWLCLVNFSTDGGKFCYWKRKGIANN